MVAEGCLAAWRLACHPHPNACSCLQPGRAEQGGASMLGCSFVLLWLCLVLHQGGRERLEPYWAKEAVEQVTYAHPPCPPAPCTAARATGEPSNSICHSALWSSCHQPPAPPPPPHLLGAAAHQPPPSPLLTGEASWLEKSRWISKRAAHQPPMPTIT